MDDGSSDVCGYKFSVDCFNLDEIKILQELLGKYNIKTTYNINQNKTIHIKSCSAKDFKNLVEPYMCDCMKYKLLVYKYQLGKCIKVVI